jgi:hypothetical protein
MIMDTLLVLVLLYYSICITLLLWTSSDNSNTASLCIRTPVENSPNDQIAPKLLLPIINMNAVILSGNFNLTSVLY